MSLGKHVFDSVIGAALSYNFVINIFIIVMFSATKKVLSYLSVILSLGHDVLTLGIFRLFAGIACSIIILNMLDSVDANQQVVA